jgi:hypothetical protein
MFHPSLRTKIIIVLVTLLTVWFIWRVVRLLIPLIIIAIAVGWLWDVLDKKKE